MSPRENYSLDTTDFSDLIGAIYDCAIDTSLWPETMERLGEALRCFTGVIALNRRDPPQNVFLQSWNWNPEWLALAPRYAGEIAQQWHSVRHLHAALMETPSTPSRSLAPANFAGSGWMRELRRFGVVDSINFLLISDGQRVAELGLSRHESEGQITDDDLALAKLLNPHIRRAVLISDLLNAHQLRAQMLDETLDGLAAGVVVVSHNARILHANRAARQMLDGGGPIVSRGGQLASTDGDATTELRAAIGLAGDEPHMAATGSGTPILGEVPAVAHVLPLRHGQRAQLVPSDAAAAVFVNHAAATPRVDTGALARLYRLTPAETRVLDGLLSGDGLAEIARQFGITEATARTHRTHIFAKTGVSRRAELSALAWRLAPSLLAGADGGGLNPSS